MDHLFEKVKIVNRTTEHEEYCGHILDKSKTSFTFSFVFSRTLGCDATVELDWQDWDIYYVN